MPLKSNLPVLEYEIYCDQGQGPLLTNKTKTLWAAIRYCALYADQGSFAIKYPNGRWHEWKNNANTIGRRE